MGTVEPNAKSSKGRNVGISLGVVCVALVVILMVVVFYYNNIVSDNYSTINRLINEKNDLQANFQNQISQLQSQYAVARAPKLIGTINAADTRSLFQSPRLRVYGNIVNVGLGPATDALLYVEGFQGQVLAFNTTISLNTIPGESFAAYLDQNVFYTGSPLSQWHAWSNPAGIDWTWYA